MKEMKLCEEKFADGDAAHNHTIIFEMTKGVLEHLYSYYNEIMNPLM